MEKELKLPGLAVVPLKTTARAQPRLNWSKGWITGASLVKCLAAIDALRPDTRALVTAHHPLREVGTKGTALTRNGGRALAELAKRPVAAVLSGHVHDAFDITEQTANGPVRMIGAGTLSQRIRSTPPSFNEITWDGAALKVVVRNLAELSTPDMQIDDVPRTPSRPVNRASRGSCQCGARTTHRCVSALFPRLVANGRRKGSRMAHSHGNCLRITCMKTGSYAVMHSWSRSPWPMP